jgi:large subunit ribosomal protein L29
MTRVAEFYAMDGDELESRLVEARRELLNLRFQLATGQLDNVAQIKNIRRDVARVLTVLREMEIAEAEGIEFAAPAVKPERVRAQRRDEETAVAAFAAAESDEVELADEETEADVRPAPVDRSRGTEEAADEATDETAEDIDQGPQVEASGRTRTRRTRRTEESAASVESAEAAPARSRVRRSRKVETAADESAADEEQ